MPAPSKSTALEVLLNFPQCLSPADPLATREDGQKELACVEEALDDIGPGEMVGIDVRDVEFINYSFSDECFGKLHGRLLSGEHPDRFVVLVASREDLENRLQDIPIALANRKAAMLCLPDPQNTTEQYITGEISESLKETLKAVEPGDTNEILAEKLNIKLTTCINRTDKLASMRLLRKKLHAGEHGYKQYEFSPILTRFE